jgi:hypothetical protein
MQKNKQLSLLHNILCFSITQDIVECLYLRVSSYKLFNHLKNKIDVIAKVIPVKNKKILSVAIFRCVFSRQIIHERHNGRLPQPFLSYFFTGKGFAMTSVLF